MVLAEFAVVANDHAWRYTGSEQRCGELPAGLIGEHVALRTRSSERHNARSDPEYAGSLARPAGPIGAVRPSCATGVRPEPWSRSTVVTRSATARLNG